MNALSVANVQIGNIQIGNDKIGNDRIRNAVIGRMEWPFLATVLVYYTANFWKTQFTGSMSKSESTARSVHATVCTRTICTPPLVKTPDIHVVETTRLLRNVLSSFYACLASSRPPPFYCAHNNK